jgi:hypothetical protein
MNNFFIDASFSNLAKLCSAFIADAPGRNTVRVSSQFSATRQGDYFDAFNSLSAFLRLPSLSPNFLIDLWIASMLCFLVLLSFLLISSSLTPHVRGLVTAGRLG